MTISPTFQTYLAAKNVEYDVVAHEPTKSSMRTAEACRVSGDCVAKAVVLGDEYGYVLAILSAIPSPPASGSASSPMSR